MKRISLIALLLFAVLLSQSVSLHSEPESLDSVCLENDYLLVIISQNSGKIISFFDKNLDEDLCVFKGHYTWRNRPPYRIPAGIEIRDELKNEVFSDRRQEAQTLGWQVENDGDNFQSAAFDKKFPGADFLVRETFELDGKSLKWKLSLKKNSGARDRSVNISYLFPLPCDPWHLWAPTSRPNRREVHPEIPFTIRHGLDRGGHYARGKEYAPLPMVSFYQPEKNRHLSFCVPPDVENVLVHFTNITDQPDPFIYNSLSYKTDEFPYFATTFYYLGLRDSKSTDIELVINSGAGEYRTSLAWLRDNYKEWFLPVNNKAYEDAGFYGVSWPIGNGVSDSAIREDIRWQKEMGLSLAQTHGNFPQYGLYVTDDSTWECIPHPQKNAGLSVASIRRLIELNREMGVSVYPYFNVVDGQKDYVEENFPGQIVRDALGDRVIEFESTYLMNADPELAFGSHLIDQAEKYLDTFSAAAGIYFDNAGKNYQVDFAHDDGITMIGNRPAYAMKFAFLRILSRLDTLFHKRNKCIIGYSAEYLEALRGIDIHDNSMTGEGKVPMAEASRFMMLDKRPVILEDGRQKDHLELYYQYCLWLGAQPTVPDSRFEGDNLEVFNRYAPYLHALKIRRWLLEPNAVTLPAQQGLVGNIFQLPDGNFMLILASLGESMFGEGCCRNLSVGYNLPENTAVERIVIHSLDNPGDSLVTTVTDYSDNGGKLQIPRHRSTSIAIFETK